MDVLKINDDDDELMMMVLPTLWVLCTTLEVLGTTLWA